ncbi:hypothetical protein P5673_000400, partial [Acropora cervicornis]
MGSCSCMSETVGSEIFQFVKRMRLHDRYKRKNHLTACNLIGSVSEPQGKLKVREQLIQGNQKRLIGVKKRIRIISLLFKLIEEDKCQANTR